MRDEPLACPAALDQCTIPDNLLIKDLEKKLIGFDPSLSDHKKALLLLRFVQSYPYKYDSESKYHDWFGVTDYWDYPYQLLFDGEDDCEDQGILCASLLEAADYDAALFEVLVKQVPTDDWGGHVFCGINLSGCSGTSYLVNNKNFYICEVTSQESSWLIGLCNIGYNPWYATQIEYQVDV